MSPPFRRPRGAGALLVLLAAGCGLGRGPDAPVPAESPESGHRDCWYTEDPDSSLSLSDVGRAALRGNIGLWGRNMEPSDTVTASVRYDDDGRLQWVRTIRSTLSPDRTRALEDLIFNDVDENHQGDWGVRVTVAGGDVVAVEPSVICEPEVRLPVTPPATALVADAGMIRAFQRIRGRRIPVLVTLDEDGRILEARIVRSTHNQYVDEYIINYVWASNFKPKLHDRFGVTTTFEVELYFPRRP